MNTENSGKQKKKSRIFGNFCYDFIKITGALPALLFVRPKIIYAQGKKPRLLGALLISSNHIGFLDPIIVHTAVLSRRLHSLATKDLYKNKLAEFFFDRVHCIKTDKDNFSLSAFHTIIDRLNNGCAVVVFPEGEINRAKDRGVLTFKAGITLMAHKSGAPILPMYIVKREKWYHRQYVVIGQPIDIRSLLGEVPSMESITNASETLRENELSLYQYYETHIRKSHSKPTAENYKEQADE